MFRRLLFSAPLVGLLVAAPSALAVAPTVDHPRPDQTFTTANPTFDGRVPLEQTQGYPLIQHVAVRVTGTGYDETHVVAVSSTGGWVTNAFTLANARYRLTACNADPGASPDCAPAVNFSVAKSSPGDFKLSAPRSTMDALDRGRVPVTFRCPASCDVSLRVMVSRDAARRMGIPSWRRNQTIARLDVSGGSSAKTVHLSLARNVAAHIRGSFQFKLFKELPVTVSADFGATEKSAATTLTWPDYPSRPSHAFNHRIFLSVRGPKRISLSKSFAVFHVRIARIPRSAGNVFFAAAIFTAGGLLTSSQDNGLPPAVARNGGTFTLKLPIAHARGVRQVRKVAPLAAVLRMGLLVKHRNKSEDAPDRFFTLVK
jgi:hypothetical protein